MTQSLPKVVPINELKILPTSLKPVKKAPCLSSLQKTDTATWY